MIYHFYQKEWKLKKSITNSHGKTEYVIHIRNLKQALIHGLILKKFHRMIKFSQNEWLKLYIDMNTNLRKQAKNNFEKDFFKLMNNAVFRETMKNVKKLFSIRNKLSYYNVFQRKFINNRYEKNSNVFE